MLTKSGLVLSYSPDEREYLFNTASCLFVFLKPSPISANEKNNGDKTIHFYSFLHTVDPQINNCRDQIQRDANPVSRAKWTSLTQVLL